MRETLGSLQPKDNTLLTPTPTEDGIKVFLNLQVFALGGTKTRVCLRLYLGMCLSGRRCSRL